MGCWGYLVGGKQGLQLLLNNQLRGWLKAMFRQGNTQREISDLEENISHADGCLPP
jgi:hypothetical protein